MAATIRKGDRVLVRDRPWLVKQVNAPAGTQAILELFALDGARPEGLSVISPPEEVLQLPNQDIEFDLGLLDSFSAWSSAHRLIGATLIREAEILSGVRFGRVALEAYQLAPTLRLLSKPRPSLLIADDVGLGKTIEAGLAILEFTARGRASRVLIVVPPGLMDQWKDELLDKFSLDFVIIDNAGGLAAAQTDLPAGVNPWDALPRIITSLDFLKKETVRSRALRKHWDLIIVDEAHALSESGTPENPYRTQRTRLGKALQKSCRGLLLLTATPHNGYAHSYRSLLELVEPTLATFHGTPENLQRRMDGARIRRMKSQIVRRFPDGHDEPVFPERHVAGIPVVDLAETEKELLKKVAAYCSKTARQASDTDDAELIGFAMQIIKKRALSSRAALSKTVDYRLESLRREEAREEPPSRSEVRELRADLPLGEAAAERTARRILRSAVPRDERRRKSEIGALTAIRRVIGKLPAADPKIEALINELKSVIAKDPSEKVIVFTEYRDTLEAIRLRIDEEPNFSGRYVLFHGGLSRKIRLAREVQFEQPGSRILLATDSASEGLNLQRTCRRVIHFELPWNPNRLEQRNGRVDRYGQKREPIIRYLFYPDSPEDDVLHRLVEKIKEMARKRISTPDILGLLTGRGSLEGGLVELDPESADVEQKKESLIQLFEDRTAEFISNARPLLALSPGGPEEDERICRLLDTVEPLLPDDTDFEAVALGALGPAAFHADPERAHIYRIDVPPQFQGEKVLPTYGAVTFRRMTAVRFRPNEVEYITPLHPLAAALSASARRRLIQVFSLGGAIPPRRLAARAVAGSEPASVLFTFHGAICDQEGPIEEHVLAVRLTADARLLGKSAENLALLTESDRGQEIDPEAIQNAFADPFNHLRSLAKAEASRQLKVRAEEVSIVRERQARAWLEELEADAADRMREIEEEEKLGRGLIEATGQQRLFPEDGDSSPRGFVARKAAVEAFKDERRREIELYQKIAEPESPLAMGALFLMPKERAQ